MFFFFFFAVYVWIKMTFYLVKVWSKNLKFANIKQVCENVAKCMYMYKAIKL